MALPSAASAAASIQQIGFTQPLTFSVINPCNGEAVTLTGENTLSGTLRTDASGGTHFNFIASFDASGVGSLGNTYLLNQVQTGAFEMAPGSVATSRAVFNLVSPDAAPNLTQESVIHFTFTPAGELTANVVQMETHCAGQP